MEYLITLVSLTTDQGSKEIPTSKVLILCASVVFCASVVAVFPFSSYPTFFNSRSFFKNFREFLSWELTFTKVNSPTPGVFYQIFPLLWVGTRPTPTNLLACSYSFIFDEAGSSFVALCTLSLCFFVPPQAPLYPLYPLPLCLPLQQN